MSKRVKISLYFFLLINSVSIFPDGHIKLEYIDIKDMLDKDYIIESFKTELLKYINEQNTYTDLTEIEWKYVKIYRVYTGRHRYEETYIMLYQQGSFLPQFYVTLLWTSPAKMDSKKSR